MIGICDEVMTSLSYFPWNGANCSVHDMVSLLSNSWLSDYHIDSVLTKISQCYLHHYGAEASSCHTFLPVFDISAIGSAYKSCGHHRHTEDKGKHLLEVENSIILGHIYSVAGVLHLYNHWTSLVVTFRTPRIFYGDSLEKSMPSDKASCQDMIFLNFYFRPILRPFPEHFPLHFTLGAEGVLPRG